MNWESESLWAELVGNNTIIAIFSKLGYYLQWQAGRCVPFPAYCKGQLLFILHLLQDPASSVTAVRKLEEKEDVKEMLLE